MVFGLRFVIIVFLFSFSLTGSSQQFMYCHFDHQQQPELIALADGESAQDKCHDIIHQLRHKGYLEASLDSLYQQKDTAIALIHRGSQYQIEALTTFLVRENTTQKSITFTNYEMLSQHIENKLITYRNSGYPFSSASAKILSVHDTLIQLSIVWQKKRKVTIDTIRLIKNTELLNPDFLFGYLNIHPGEPFHQEKINNITKKIKQLSFVQLSAAPRIRFNGDQASIELELESRASNTFDGIIGFTTQNNDKLQLSGQATVDLTNAFSQGEALSIDWAAPGQQSQSLLLQSDIPYLFRTPFGLSLDFSLYKQDSSYVNLDFKGGIQYQFSYHNKASVYYQHASSDILTDTIINIQTLPYRSHGLGVSYTLNNLDLQTMPRKGWTLFAAFTASTKQLPQNTRLSESVRDSLNPSAQSIATHLKLERYFNPYPRSVIYIQNESKYLEDKQISKNQLYRLGGIQNLKGFDEDQFRVKAYSLLHLEYRFLLERYSYLLAFGNMAITQGHKKDVSYPYGFGAGLAFQTDAGLFNLFYAIGKQHNQPLLFRNSKIHFGFKSLF